MWRTEYVAVGILSAVKPFMSSASCEMHNNKSFRTQAGAGEEEKRDNKWDERASKL